MAQHVNVARQNLQQLQAQAPAFTGLLGPIANRITGRRRITGKERVEAQQAADTEVADNLLLAGFDGQDPTAFDFGVSPLQLDNTRRLLDNPETRGQGLLERDQLAARAGFTQPLGALDQAMLDKTRQQVINFQQTEKINAENLNQERIQTQIAEMDFEKRVSGVPDSAKVMDTAIRFGTARDAQLKPYQSSVDAFNRIRELGVAGMSPANATSLLFQFIQTQDNTAVRDGERVMVAAQGGPMRELVNKINLYSAKGAFSQEAWDDITQSAGVLAKAQFDTMQGINDRWDQRMGKFANEYMMPALVELTQSTLFNPEQTFDLPPAATGQPQPGAAADGNRTITVDTNP